MRAIGVLAVLVILLSACNGSTAVDPDARPGPAPDGDGGQAADPRSVDVYAAVVRRLVVEDYAFGVKHVYVVDGVVEGAGKPHVGGDVVRKRFTPAVKDGIARALADLPRVEFVADADSVIVDRGSCGVENCGVLISLGPIKGQGGGRVSVPNGLFFAGKGAQWLTYVLKRGETGWRVVGTTGPVVIS